MPDRSASTVTILLLLAGCSHESLEVVPARIDVSPASVDFGMQEVGVPTTAILEVTNDSPATLEVARITVAQTGSVFSVSPVELRVERRSAASVTVTFTPAGVADYSSELVIDSNAEDRPVLHIPLAGAVHTVGPASYAGGIDLYRTATSVMTLHNVVVAGNHAYLGGGVLTNQGGSHVLENVTIAGNTADYAAGMYIESSMTPILNNVIIANNTASIDGGGVRAIDASFSLTYTTFFNNAPQDFVGTWNPVGVDGNISNDPLFTDTSSADPTQWDLTLQDGSPSIDTGDVDIFDPDSSRSNMGAYGGLGSADW